MHRTILALFVALITTVSSSPAFAWGERGHDLITRVAARIAAQRGGPQFAKPFVDKEHMLGHLSNVPDIVWRSLGREIDEQNGPTHYIDVEYIDLTPTFAEMPTSTKDMLGRMQTLCGKPSDGYICPTDKIEQLSVDQAGTAPFRIKQFFELMKSSLVRAKGIAVDKDGSKERSSAVNDALLAAGIMAHFVGDLGNPMHTTRDYNGYERGQGGLHAYFESELVSALDLGLDQEVFIAANDAATRGRLAKVVPNTTVVDWRADPLLLTNALVLDSFSRLSAIFDLDKQKVLTKAGSNERGMKVPAERRPASVVAPLFRPLIVERLATAADTLAQIWLLAWEQAGKPDLSTYASWDYPTAPAFIPTNYMPK